MASFNEHYSQNRNTFRQQAEESYNQAASANQAATDQYLADIDAIFKENAQQLEQSYNQRISQLPQDYQYAYDKNAIQQAINEREVAGRMEQLGLTDSGLNRTQQAAINLQRSNADAAVTQQQNAQLNALSSALAEQLAQNRANQTASAAQARYDLATRNQDLYNTYMSNADSMAASIASSLYSADQQRAAAEAQAAAQQQQAYYDYLAKNSQSISDMAWQMAKSDANNYLIPEGQSIYDVYNMYLNQLTGAGEGIKNPGAGGDSTGNAGTGSEAGNTVASISDKSFGAYNYVLQKAQAEISNPAASQRRPYSALRVIDQAEASGQITEDQADRIIEILGLQGYIAAQNSRNQPPTPDEPTTHSITGTSS